MRRLFVLLPFLLLSSITVTAQESDTVRVCTYNILRFAPTSNDRFDELRSILNEIDPQILVIQELSSREAHDVFEDSIASTLNRPLASIGFYSHNDVQDSYVAIYYDSALMVYLYGGGWTDTPRTMVSGRFFHRPSRDSFEIMTGHWKAGESSEDEAQRLTSGELVWEYFLHFLKNDDYPLDNMIFAGDMNVYSEDEPGYGVLMWGDTSLFVDPINRQGDWNNDIEFADVHTQSTRVRSFGGGVTGGLDDRFDQILVSRELLEYYVPGSYTTFGNDGQHFNDSINALPNLAVGPVMAQALHDASDHLPVYLDLVFPRVTTDVKDESMRYQLDLVGED